MFCSNCGAAVPRGTNFCNLCGAKLSGERGGGSVEPSGLSPDSLVWASVAVFVVGLGGLLGPLAVMKETVGFGNDVILAVAAVFLFLMVAIEAVFVGLQLKRTRAARPAAQGAAPKPAETKELAAARPAALPEHPPAEPLPSVTEHTTRAFGPSYVERARRSAEPPKTSRASRPGVRRESRRPLPRPRRVGGRGGVHTRQPAAPPRRLAALQDGRGRLQLPTLPNRRGRPTGALESDHLSTPELPCRHLKLWAWRGSVAGA
jgi:hypothetical protein